MIKKLLFVFFLLFSVNCVFAQTKIASLRSNVYADEFTLITDSAESFLTKNPAKSVALLERALKIAIQEGDLNKEDRCYFLLGKANYNLKLYVQSTQYFEKVYYRKRAAVKFKSDYSLEENLALAYEASNQIEKAKGILKSINSAYQNTSDRKAWINNFYGRLAYKSGNETEAMKYFKLVSVDEKNIKNQVLVAEANEYLGKMYSQNDDKAKSQDYYRKSVRAAEKSENEDLVEEKKEKLKEQLYQDKEYDKVYEMNQSTMSQQITPTAANKITIENATILVEKERAKEAIPTLQKSIKKADELKNVVQKTEAYKTLSKAYQQTGDYDKALESYKQYSRYQDSIYAMKERDLKEMNNVIERVTTINKNIGVLEKDKEITAQVIAGLKKDKENQRYLIYALVLILLVITISSYLLVKNIRQKKMANQILALKSLRSQMNPHFIFNALNSVNSFISANDQKTANKYLGDFSKLMRSVLENSQKDFVPLSEEIEVLKLYMKLEHFRFSNKFDYTFEVDEEMVVDQYKVPPMLVQPYIENAVWHGLRYKDDKGMLKVRVSAEQNHLKVLIEDDGIGRKKSQALKTKNQKQNESMALKNIETRLHIINELYKTNLKVNIEDANKQNGEGTIVTILIPFQKQ